MVFGVHMGLLDYLKMMESVEKLDGFAVGCGTSVAHLYQVARCYRRAGESLAINIERESGGVVRCEDLRPDVDWAYLRNSGSSEKEAA